MKKLAVAITWNQGYYIPWNGCHPLYQGLVDPAPEGVEINAWDHVALQEKLAGSAQTQQWLMAELATLQAQQLKVAASQLALEDQLLIQRLPGDMEFFHSIPFPSLTRPFWLHIESPRSLFSPWLAAPKTIDEQLPGIREHYRELLSSPWCLGVSSHLPETLQELSDFLDHPAITPRLFTTPFGLPALPLAGATALRGKPALASPRFLFAVSTDPGADFLTSGGHRVLRTWKALCKAGQPGILTMACERPSAAAIEAAGVDSDFVEQQTGHSILWTDASHTEVDALMAGSHVFLQPADVLCTYDILRAMRLGCVPVIAAVPGSARLLQDNLHGLTVGTEPLPTEPWERPVRSWQDDEQIIEELITRIPLLLTATLYNALQNAAQQRAVTGFPVQAFAHSVWTEVLKRYAHSRHAKRSKAKSSLQQCLLTGDGLRRAFSANARPQLRINTGLYGVWSQGGYYVMVEGSLSMAAPQWSVLPQYTQAQARPLVFAHSLPDLQGIYLPQPATAPHAKPTYVPRTVRALSQLLLPFPRLHSTCSHWLRRYRHLRQRFSNAGANGRDTGPANPTRDKTATPHSTTREDTHDAL